MEMASQDQEDLGLGLKPGDPQYRAYVGPPEDYDLIAAMTFNLLTTLGLRQHHSLLDIGCGSLRIGRLVIPYLNRGKYFGVEPNEWLGRRRNQTGAGRNVGADQTPDILLLRFPRHDCARENRFRFRSRPIDLQSLRSRSDRGLVVCDFGFTGPGRSAGCHVFDRRGRLRENGLDLSRVRKLSARNIGKRSKRCEFAIRNSGLETSTSDVGSFCRARI